MLEAGEAGAREQTIAPPRLLASLFALGVAFDLAANGQRPGASIPLFVALVAVAMRPVLRRSASDDVLLASAVTFSTFCAFRAAPWLVALDVLAVCALIGLVAARDVDSVFRVGLESLVRRAFHLMVAGLRVPGALLVPLGRAVARVQPSRVTRVARAAAIAIPVVVVFALLLASADRVFGDLLLPGLPDLDLGGVASHVALTVIGTGIVALLWCATRLPIVAPFGGDGPRARLAPSDWITVLVGIDLLFGLFVVVQFAVLFGGAGRVEVTPGLTYAEYARSGFFQLIAVAALVTLVILGGWDLGRREGARDERRFRLLVTAMVALTGVILASAFLRLALYEGTFGFTVPRLAAYVGICWIGFVLVAMLVAIWTGARERVIAAAIAGGLIALLAVNVLNPERFVAERNVARYREIGKVDARYLATRLGHDAVPVVVGLLDDLPPRDARGVRSALCVHALDLRGDPGWRSWNLGRRAASDALARAGIGPGCDAPPGD